MNPYEIVKRPLNTEKTNTLRDDKNQVSFEVSREANRTEIKKAVESIFKVAVKSVRTMQVKGKIKQRGKITGKRRDWKKAIVSLAPGERIEFFEGV
jgi:large subunit ribosomal protein L23